ncbi:hypothetical protein [Rhizobium leguminosarum]|uniref:hypothetical protein n=1 Tax=Rhizobium leguminosarum TaxID=384 RepID=UPI002E11C4B2|nr:hypothetical protein U8Q02_39655 [Rhizobium leguminosarum]
MLDVQFWRTDESIVREAMQHLGPLAAGVKNPVVERGAPILTARFPRGREQIQSYRRILGLSTTAALVSILVFLGNL